MNIRKSLLVALAIASLGIAGCEKDESSTEKSDQPPSGEALNATGPTGAQPTTETQDALTAELQALQERVDDLQQKASERAQEGKASLAEQLNALKQQRQALEQKANEAAASGVKHVNDLLGKLNKSLDVLTRSVERESSEENAAAASTAPSEGSK